MAAKKTVAPAKPSAAKKAAAPASKASGKSAKPEKPATKETKATTPAQKAPVVAAPAKAAAAAAAAPAPTAGKRGRPPGSTKAKAEENAKKAGKAPKEEPKKLVTKTQMEKPSKAPVAYKSPDPAKKPLKEEEPANLGKIKTVHPPEFLQAQRLKLLQLRDDYISSVNGMAEETLRSPANDGGSAFGMHQADAGSDSYDRDFALSLLSQEQDSILEIDAALKRITANTYGMCEMCGKPIPLLRLEARPFARFTVDCQVIVEKEMQRTGGRFGLKSLFGLGEDEEDDDDEDNDSLENEKD